MQTYWVVRQVPGNTADVVSCERLQNLDQGSAYQLMILKSFELEAYMQPTYNLLHLI
jgi:hypothetical protein